MDAQTAISTRLASGRPPDKDMVWIPGGSFLMGSDRHYPEEAPVHAVALDGFWIDTFPVTNAAFRRFVKVTGYVTTAERTPAVEDYPGADPGMLVPGSIVFAAPTGRVDLGDHYAWWAWTPGADWRRPDGPGSTLDGRERLRSSTSPGRTSPPTPPGPAR